MPLPLLPGQEFYIAHRFLPADYEMPIMEASTDHYSMGYIISGNRVIITPDRTYYRYQGDLGTMRPYTYHKTMPLSPELGIPYEGILIKFSPKFAEPFIASVGQAAFDEVYSAKCVHCFCPEDSERILAHMLEMTEIYEGSFEHKTALLQYMLYELFLMVLQLHIDASDDNSVSHKTTLSEPIIDALYYMEKNYNKNPTLEEAAHAAGYSPAYFSRLFQAQLGKTYIEYLAGIKLLRVQHLLLCTDKPITEIAFDTGYRHVSNLSSQFKKMTGMSPLQYRRLK